jgi:hypothetical protein
MRVLACACTLAVLLVAASGQESDEMSAAQIMYPCMQCADIFFLGVCFLVLLGHAAVAFTAVVLPALLLLRVCQRGTRLC